MLIELRADACGRDVACELVAGEEPLGSERKFFLLHLALEIGRLLLIFLLPFVRRFLDSLQIHGFKSLNGFIGVAELGRYTFQLLHLGVIFCFRNVFAGGEVCHVQLRLGHLLRKLLIGERLRLSVCRRPKQFL